MTAKSDQEIVWTNADVAELLTAFKWSLDMMEGCYTTSHAGKSVRDTYERFNQRQDDLKPVVVEKLQNAKCKICDKEFTESRHHKVFTADEQNKAVMSHLISVHNIQDYDVRRKNIQKASVTRTVYKNRNDFNRGIVQQRQSKKA